MFEDILLQRTEKLIKHCSELGVGITTVESCTGGLLSALLTSVSGASEAIHSNIIVYDNAAKQHYVQVQPDTLRSYGAVSEEVAGEMAWGRSTALQSFNNFKHVVSLSITGIAGPNGGTKDKPVGTVCFGCAVDNSINTKTYHFDGFRHQVRMHAVRQAVRLLEEAVKKIEQS